MKEKRLKIAMAALTGLIAKYNLSAPEDQEIICKMAFQLADEMLKREKI